MKEEISYRYFSASSGRVVPRYGTKAFIGAIKTKTGFVVDSDEVVRIPALEVRRYLREYLNLLRKSPRHDAALIERTQKEYEKYHERSARDSSANDQPEKGEKKSSRRKVDEKSVSELFGSDGGEGQ